MKFCKKCGVQKDDSEFDRIDNLKYKNKMNGWCNQCCDSYMQDLNQKRILCGLPPLNNMVTNIPIDVHPYKANNICKIIKKHNQDLEEDPERLTTDFLTSVICNPLHRKKYLEKEIEKIKFDPDAKWKRMGKEI
jgi:hypothetical protein